MTTLLTHRYTASERRPRNRLVVEGQVRGVTPMVTEDRYCIDELTQIAANADDAREDRARLLDGHVRVGMQNESAGPRSATNRSRN